MDFVIVHLEFCPPAGAVAWAIRCSRRYPNRIGIMTTHGYLNETAQRTVHGCTQHAVPVGRPGRAQSEPALHAERPRARRVAAHRRRCTAIRSSRCWPTTRIARAAARAGCASCGSCRRRQGLRADVFAVAQSVRDRCEQRVLAGLPDGRRLHHAGHDVRGRAARARPFPWRAWRPTPITSGR